jgi:mRNA-degrading endonuclease RelE of RelBE toxin-antitoxin system
LVEYSIVLKATAAERLEAVEPQRDRRVLRFKIAGLTMNPRPSGVETFPGYTDRCRLRHRGYRILYSIDESGKAVTIIGIGYRRSQNSAESPAFETPL